MTPSRMISRRLALAGACTAIAAATLARQPEPESDQEIAPAPGDPSAKSDSISN